MHAIPAHPGHVERRLAGERLEPPEVAVLRLCVDAGVRQERLPHPAGRDEPAAVLAGELTPVRGVRGSSAGARRPSRSCPSRCSAATLREYDAERREQLPLRERSRATRPPALLEGDAEQDHARSAVAEASRSDEPAGRARTAASHSSGYMRSSLPGDDSSQSLQSRRELIVSRSRTVSCSFGDLQGTRRLRQQRQHRDVDASPQSLLDRDAEQHPEHGLRAGTCVAEGVDVAVDVVLPHDAPPPARRRHS